jgi:hypothetical protein
MNTGLLAKYKITSSQIATCFPKYENGFKQDLWTQIQFTASMSSWVTGSSTVRHLPQETNTYTAV